MSSLSNLFDRQLYSLASELDYKLTLDEVSFYIEHLAKYGIKRVAIAALCLRESGYPKGQFPSIEEFERNILEGMK